MRKVLSWKKKYLLLEKRFKETNADSNFKTYRLGEQKKEIQIYHEKNIRQFAMIEELRSQIDKYQDLLERIYKK